MGTSQHRATRNRVPFPALLTDLGAQAIAPDGRARDGFAIDDIAAGSRATVKRARRCEPLDRIALAPEEKAAAVLLRQAWEHMHSGRAWLMADVAREPSRSRDAMPLLPAERAISAAEAYRRGIAAIGSGRRVVQFVVLDGNSLRAYDAWRQWRESRGCDELRAALARLAVAYGLVVAR